MAMSDLVERLESALVRKPFDQELRFSYAEELFRLERFESALEQYELLCEMTETAQPLLGCARCQIRLDRDGKALELYTEARNREGFEELEEIESLEAVRVGAPQLTAVEGGQAEVIEFYRPDDSRVRFEDVAGMDALKRTLRIQIIEPFLRPGLFQRFRKDPGGGVLLYGPPGCGKTMMARAVAGECHASFISVGISDVLSVWHGGSEENLAMLFEQARANRPCVLFFDELDAIAYSRSKSSSDGARTVVNEFLAQLDGFDRDNRSVLVLAATNMPWDVDPAMKRPGRLSRQIFVPPPDVSARAAMFESKLREVPVGEVDPLVLARAAEYFSGADIDGVIDAAKDFVLGDIIDSGTERQMRQEDLLQALDAATPTTMDWLKIARNLVKYAGADASYRDVEKYLKKVRFF